MPDVTHSAAAPVARLIQEFHKLPGIGPKSAQRLTYYLLRASPEEAQALAQAILEVKEKIAFCSICQNVTDTDPCLICDDPQRDRSASSRSRWTSSPWSAPAATTGCITRFTASSRRWMAWGPRT